MSEWPLDERKTLLMRIQIVTLSSLLLLGLLLPLAGRAPGAPGEARYRVIDLGSKDPRIEVVPQGINDAGQVVGYFKDAGGVVHGFRTAPGRPIEPATDDLGGLGTSGTTYAFGINALG